MGLVELEYLQQQQPVGLYVLEVLGGDVLEEGHLLVEGLVEYLLTPKDQDR